MPLAETLGPSSSLSLDSQSQNMSNFFSHILWPSYIPWPWEKKLQWGQPAIAWNFWKLWGKINPYILFILSICYSGRTVTNIVILKWFAEGKYLDGHLDAWRKILSCTKKSRTKEWKLGAWVEYSKIKVEKLARKWKKLTRQDTEVWSSLINSGWGGPMVVFHSNKESRMTDSCNC